MALEENNPDVTRGLSSFYIRKPVSEPARVFTNQTCDGEDPVCLMLDPFQQIFPSLLLKFSLFASFFF